MPLESGDGEADDFSERKTMNDNPLPQIRVNDSIAYKLLPEQRPTNPDRIYHGLVVDILFNDRVLQVDLLDPGYDGMSELVLLSQVVEVRRIPQEGQTHATE